MALIQTGCLSPEFHTKQKIQQRNTTFLNSVQTTTPKITNN
jgi:hypothetical protein